MAGSSSVENNQVVTFTDNMSFDGTDRGGAMTTDGQLWIGATASNRPNDGGHVRLGNIISSDGSINVVNGPGSIDIRGQAQGFQPNAVLQEFDDFIEGNISISPGKLNWTLTNNSGTLRTGPGTADHPGIYFYDAGLNEAGIALSQRESSSVRVGPFIVGGGTITASWVLKLDTLSAANSYTFYNGFTDATSFSAIPTVAPDSGIYFSYTDTVNTGYWVLNCTNAGVTTSVNTSVPVTTDWTTLTVLINSAGTSVSFLVNNVVVGTAITTNIPVTSITPFILALSATQATEKYSFDLFYIVNVLNNPRPGPTNPAITGSNGRLLLSYTATPISYQVLGTDAIIGVTSTAAARTITMPNASLTTGQQWEIKDESGAAATNNITVSGNGYLIDGAATYAISTNYGSVSLYWSGTNFYLV